MKTRGERGQRGRGKSEQENAPVALTINVSLHCTPANDGVNCTFKSTDWPAAIKPAEGVTRKMVPLGSLPPGTISNRAGTVLAFVALTTVSAVFPSKTVPKSRDFLSSTINAYLPIPWTCFGRVFEEFGGRGNLVKILENFRGGEFCLRGECGRRVFHSVIQ